MKLLKDFPLNEWVEAADGCEYCDEKARVKVTFIEGSGTFGDVEIEHRHKESCHEIMEGIIHELAGWEYFPLILKLGDAKLPTLKSRGNIGICANCEKFIVGVPLILWPGDGGFELDLCFDCAEKLNIPSLFVKGETE